MIGVRDRQRAEAGRRIALRIGEVEVTVESDLRQVIDDLSVLYGHLADGAGPRTGSIRMEIRRAGRLLRPRRRYAVLGDGEPFGTDLRRREVLPYVEWGVNWRLIAGCSDHLLVHAASMSRHGRGVILAGRSGAGKSTLVAGLLSRGWQYLCDEFAMVDARTLELKPFPKAVCVKAGAFDLVRRLKLQLSGDRHYVNALKGTVGYISPADLPAPAATGACPVSHIVFPRYTGHDEARLRPITSARAAFMLASHTLNRHLLGARAASIASDLARGARCAGLESGDIERACNLLERLVG